MDSTSQRPWRTSSYTGANGGNCVEIGHAGTYRGPRHQRPRRTGPRHKHRHLAAVRRHGEKLGSRPGPRALAAVRHTPGQAPFGLNQNEAEALPFLHLPGFRTCAVCAFAARSAAPWTPSRYQDSLTLAAVTPKSCTHVTWVQLFGVSALIAGGRWCSRCPPALLIACPAAALRDGVGVPRLRSSPRTVIAAWHSPGGRPVAVLTAGIWSPGRHPGLEVSRMGPAPGAPLTGAM